MALTALAIGAATAFAQGVAGQLGGQAAAAFSDLRKAVRLRLSGDERARDVVAAVERHPNDDKARQTLASVLAQYAAADPHFADYLDRSVRYIQYFDNSNRGNLSVGRDNRGSIRNRVDDHRIYQSGGNLAGRDINIDESRLNLELDPIRSAKGIPKLIMVLGMLVAFAGLAVFFFGVAQGILTTGATSGTPAGPGPEEQAIVQRTLIGFGIAFVGIALVAIGNIFRPKDR